MYKQKATKAEIDFIRGVDSSRSIKNLLTRGIIESLTEKNRRHFIPTTESLRYLNLDQVENLIDYNEVSEKLSSLINGQ
jgi:chromosome segregation and condensation protein ScpB